MSLEPLARSTSGAPLAACLLASLLLGACASPPPAPLPERPSDGVHGPPVERILAGNTPNSVGPE